MSQLKIIDESGDKKYFTQLPNIILNHSTANDQALYMQMKRFAGEDGKCFATQETLCKKLSIGTKAYNKSLDYLIKRKWIKYEGMTQGKTRPIKTYSVVDIWRLNIMEYEKILVESTVSFEEEILVESRGDTCPKHNKILVESTVEEEHIIKKNHKEEELPDWLNKEIWLNWISYRKERRKPLTNQSIRLQLKDLGKDIPHHVDILEQSIKNGWTGLFPLKGNIQSGKSNLLKDNQNKYDKFN